MEELVIVAISSCKQQTNAPVAVVKRICLTLTLSMKSSARRFMLCFYIFYLLYPEVEDDGGYKVSADERMPGLVITYDLVNKLVFGH